MFRALTYQLLRGWHFLLIGPRLLARALSAPFRAVGWLFLRIGQWWSRRETRYLLRGLPALIVFLGVACLSVAGWLRSDTALADQYFAAANQAVSANKPEDAALLLERVVRLRPADNDTLYRLASLAQQSGDHVRAAVLYGQLAPEEGQGHAPAQIDVGRYYLSRVHQSKDNFRRAETHLEHALTLEPQNAAAHALLGQLYLIRGGLWDLTIAHFEDALKYSADRRNEQLEDLQVVQLLLAKAHSFRGNLENDPAKKEADLKRAEGLATAARAHLAARVAADPKEDIQARILLADACLFLEEFDAAAETLEEGLALNDQDAMLRSALAQFSVAWSDAMLKDGRGTRERRFELLSAALLLDPNYAAIFDRMLAILTEEGATAAAAREFLLSNLANGKSIGLSHLLLGSAAYEAQDSKEAAYHLELAFESLRNAPIVVNNLAWFLAFRDPPELDRALQLVTEALERAPDDPRFLDTRGQIYTKQQRWDEAIADLERALAIESPARETHLALADCYEAKGLKDLAVRHRQLGESTTP